VLYNSHPQPFNIKAKAFKYCLRSLTTRAERSCWLRVIQFLLIMQIELGDQTKAAIRSGAQLLLKQVFSGKYIFNARIMYPDGSELVGNISTSEEGALANLEGSLQHQPNANIL